jgi:hypothetical protein
MSEAALWAGERKGFGDMTGEEKEGIRHEMKMK